MTRTDPQLDIEQKVDQAIALLATRSETAGERMLLHGLFSKSHPHLNSVEIDAQFIVNLLTNWEQFSPDFPSSLVLDQANIVGQLRYVYGNFPYQLTFVDCECKNPIIFDRSTIGALSFIGNAPSHLCINHSTISGNVSIALEPKNGVFLNLSIEAKHAEIRGNFELSHANIVNDGLQAHLISVDDGMNIQSCEFNAAGANLSGATIGGVFTFENSKFHRDGCLDLSHAILANDVHISSPDFNGRLDLQGANLEGNLLISRSKFDAQSGAAINLANIEIADDVTLHEVTSSKPIRSNNAKFGSDFLIINGHLSADFKPEMTTANPGTKDENAAISLENARIEGKLTLSEGLCVTGVINLTRAKIGSSLGILDGVNLVGTRSTLIAGEEKLAVAADGCEISGNLEIANSEITGQVRARNAKVGGHLAFRSATVNNPGQTAIQVDHITTGSNVYFENNFKAYGMVVIRGAQIGGRLTCRDCYFESMPDGAPQPYNGTDDEEEHRGIALLAGRMKIARSIYFDKNFVAKGEVRLRASEVGRNLNCRGATFQTVVKDGDAFNGDNMVIGSHIYMDSRRSYSATGAEMGIFNSTGRVRLSGATVGRDLVFTDALLNLVEKDEAYFQLEDDPVNIHDAVLLCDGITVGGRALFDDGFYANGKIRLVGANVKSHVIFGGSTIKNKNGFAISARGLSTEGSVYINKKAFISGEVRLGGASISGDLDLSDSHFERAAPALRDLEHDKRLRSLAELRTAVNLVGASIKGAYIRKRRADDVAVIHPHLNGSINFSHAQIGQFDDPEEGWPTGDYKILLEGCKYNSFAQGVVNSARTRIPWIRDNAPDDTRSTQPYEQLIKVFKGMGIERDVRDVAIAKNDQIRLYLKADSAMLRERRKKINQNTEKAR